MHLIYITFVNDLCNDIHILPYNLEKVDTCKMICQLLPVNGIRFPEKVDTLEKCQFLPANATMDARKSICIILNRIYKQKYASSPPQLLQPGLGPASAELLDAFFVFFLIG